jgi:hypothetical protein
MRHHRQTHVASWPMPAAVWQRLEPLLPPRQGNPGPPRTVTLRRLTEGIF